VHLVSRIKDCIDYEILTDKVKDLVKASNRFTLEALAEDIANVCLSTEGVLKTMVTVEKPGILPAILSAGVQIER